MSNFILGSLTMLIGIWIGYTLGKGSSIIPEETQKQVRRLIRSLPIKNDLGGVERPTAHEIDNFNNPVLKAAEEEMSETFKEIIK